LKDQVNEESGMHEKNQEAREKKIRAVTLQGAGLNVSLTALKILTGILGKSASLIADGIHSLSDLATDFVVLIAARLANRPPDVTHPYGHKRFETIATQIIAFILFLAGVQIIRSAGTAISRGETTSPGVIMLIVAGLSVTGKEIMYRITRKVSRETNSPSLHANAWHHRSDALSSVAVLIGGVFSLVGWGHADHAAAIIVGVMILIVAARIFFQGLDELSEHAASPEVVQKIRRTLASSRDIKGFHELRSRKIGGDVYLDVHILVDPDLTVQQGHDISHRIEDEIRAELKQPVNILVHIEPSNTHDEP